MTGSWSPPRPGSGTSSPVRRSRPVTAAAVLALVAATVVGALASVRPFDVLAVRVPPGADPAVTDGRTDAVLLLPLGREERFEVRYTHSVNLFTVREQFVRGDDGGVVVVEHYVDGIGAGIDEVAGETTWRSVGGGWSRLDGLSRDLDGPLRMRVGGVADHRLVVDCREVTLLEHFPSGTPLAIGWERTGPVRWISAQLRLRGTVPVTATCALPGRG